MVWSVGAGLGNQRKVFLHLSGGVVPQTPGQGGVHEQFPLNNPPRCTVLLKYKYMPSVTFGGGFDAGGGLAGPLKGLGWFGLSLYQQVFLVVDAYGYLLVVI